jgi:hypothetical protein
MPRYAHKSISLFFRDPEALFRCEFGRRGLEGPDFDASNQPLSIVTPREVLQAETQTSAA